jgi:hypothetical protein
MTDTDLNNLLIEAAEKGAEAALRKVGLHDEEAIKDILEIRSLLDTWRETKKTIGQTIAKIITTGVLAILVMGSWKYWGHS